MSKYLLKVKEYKVKDGDTIKSIAKDHGVSWEDIASFNFRTKDEEEMNLYLRAKVGCTKKASDGKTYEFTAADSPGIIYIPQPMSATEFATNGTHQLKVKIPKISIPKMAVVKVRFWPKTNWKGEYGIDWLREGDSGVAVDVDYKPITGKYNTADPPVFAAAANKYTLLCNTYAPFNIANFKSDKGGLVKNYVTYLNLFPADKFPHRPHEATIVADINVNRGKPYFLKIESDKADYKDYVDIVEDLQKNTGKQEITVKAKKGCDTDITLTVMNHTHDIHGREVKHEVGKLIVCKNGDTARKKTKVILVAVTTNLNGETGRMTLDKVNGEKKLLLKYMNQALIEAEVMNVVFDMTKPPTPGFFSRLFAKKNAEKPRGTVFHERWVAVDGDGEEVLNKVRYNATTRKWDKIHDFLEAEFNRENPDLANVYKVFLFKEQGGYGSGADFSGIGGAAGEIGNGCKTVVVFNNFNTSVVAHELMHAIGLYHTFDNNGTHTFKKHQTNNIMDYTDSVNNYLRETTMKWQWDILQANVITP